MLKLCNIDIERSQEIYERLRAFVTRLRKNFSIKEVYLYGSFVRGEIHEGSDIDLVIVGGFKGRIFQRIEEVLKLTDLPIEPLIYTTEEFRRMKNTNPFLKEVIKTGKKL